MNALEANENFKQNTLLKVHSALHRMAEWEQRDELGWK